jgi:hypothetical protein
LRVLIRTGRSHGAAIGMLPEGPAVMQIVYARCRLRGLSGCNGWTFAMRRLAAGIMLQKPTPLTFASVFAVRRAK